jgi:hypothetical protein
MFWEAISEKLFKFIEARRKLETGEKMILGRCFLQAAAYDVIISIESKPKGLVRALKRNNVE